MRKPEGTGLWKFNNTLLKDEEYVERVRETYSNTIKYYCEVANKGLLWELIEMEIRNATISYTKYKAKVSRDWAEEIRHQLEQLDNTICNNVFSLDINKLLQHYDNLKSEHQSLYENKGKQAMFRAKFLWVEQDERATKYFSIWKKEIITKRPSGNFALKTNRQQPMINRSSTKSKLILETCTLQWKHFLKMNTMNSYST